MDLQALVAAINAEHHTHFMLHGKFATGENQGAYALSDDQGRKYVLKWNERPSWVRSLQRAQQITNHLGSRGVPVPRYVLVDRYTDEVLYWVQTALPGLPPKPLSLGHAKQLVTLVERQAGQTLHTGSNWSEYVRAVVFAGHSGWQDSLAQYNAETRAVLSRLTHIVGGISHTTLRVDDICHGDMGTDNVLTQEATVTGIVDWDAAGEGDRALDLSKLLFYSYSNDNVSSLLRWHIMDISGQDAYAIYLAYNILAQLDWSIHHHSAESVAEGVEFANQVLADLEGME